MADISETPSQRAREAAADLAQWLIDAMAEWEGMPRWFATDFPAACRAGVWDNHDWPQAFARFERDCLDRPDVQERDAIVAWLRDRANSFGHGDRVFGRESLNLTADAIERGDYLNTPQAPAELREAFQVRPANDHPNLYEIWDVEHPAACNHFPVVLVNSKGAADDLHRTIADVCCAALNHHYRKTAPSDHVAKLREALDEMLAAQMVAPYRGWSLTKLNRAADAAREMLGLPSIRELNPGIAQMQDVAAANRDSIRAALQQTEGSDDR